MTAEAALRSSRTSEVDDPLPCRSRASANYLHRCGLERNLRLSLRRHLNPCGTSRVLDLGCGSRYYETLLRTGELHYVGADAHGEAHMEVRSSAEELAFQDRTFEAMDCLQTLEHVSEPESVLAEIARVLRPSGVLFLSTHGSLVFHPTSEDHWRWP